MKKTPTVTIAIPTCYGGVSLLHAIQSIRNSVKVPGFKILVVSDTQPLAKDIKKALLNLKVDVTEIQGRQTQMKKVKQMIKAASTDLFVFTQDDVRFDSLTLSKIISCFENDPKLTMLGVNIAPEPAETFFERIIEVGLRIAYRIGFIWRSGDNYLMANGRCLIFRTTFLKKFTIPEDIINADAYLYFENKKRGGTFSFAPDALVYNKSPQTLKEHVRQSGRFRYSEKELQPYFSGQLHPEYQVPLGLRLQSFAYECAYDPLHTFFYVGVFLYTMIKGGRGKQSRTALWEVNKSTKRI